MNASPLKPFTAKNRQLRLMAVLLICSVVFQGTPASPLYSEPGEIASLSNLGIPESLGKIQERFTGTSNRWVIQIQDVHAHVPAQENISAIIDHLNAIYGIKTVALEGGWLSTSFPKSWGLPNSRGKQNLARYLLDSGYLTGPGYAALFSQTPIHLIGIEDAASYESNRQVYLKYLNQQTAVKEKIAAAESQIKEAKQSLFNPELLKFDTALATFREGKKADKFLPNLLSISEAKSVDTPDLAQVNLFKQILAAEAYRDKDRLQAEAGRLMVPFKKTRLSFEEVIRSGKIAAEQLALYPQVMKYITLMKLNDQLDHQTLFKQIDVLIDKVKTALFASDEERNLDGRSERFLTAQKMMTMQATPDDLKKFDAAADPIKAEMVEAGLSDALETGIEFYDLAKKRDRIFFEKITGDDRLNGDIAVVTGGFHTEGLSAQLREAGISYVIVSPDLAGEAPNENLYMKRIQVASQTLSQFLEFLEPPFDEAFAANTGTAEKNITEAAAPIDRSLAAVPAVVQSAGRMGVLQVEVPAGRPIQEFLSLGAEERKAEVLKWARESKAGGQAILVAISDVKITKLAQSQESSSSVTNFMADKNHSLVILGSNYKGVETVKGGATLKTEFNFPTPEEYFRQPGIRGTLKRRKAAGISEALKVEGEILYLPATYLNVFDIIQLALQSGLNYLNATPQELSEFVDILSQQFEAFSEIQQAA